MDQDNQFVCVFVWCLTTHGSLASDDIKLNMISMEKVKKKKKNK